MFEMDKNQQRQMTEDIAELVTIRAVQPINDRLTVLETRLLERRRRDAVAWKVIGFGLAIPSFGLSIITLVKLLTIID
jgi:hypothetical protein